MMRLFSCFKTLWLFHLIVSTAVAADGYSAVSLNNLGEIHRHTPSPPSNNPSRKVRSLENGPDHTGSRSSSHSLNYNSTSGRPDIFEEFCSCKWARVTCDFSVNRELTTITEDNFRVPQFTSSLHVILGPSTNFILRSGIFVSAKINDLVIVGHLRGEQVEITSNVFQDHGPYPSINITDCGSVIIRTNAFLTGELKLNIRRSENVVISEHAFHNTNLRAILEGIQDLRIEEQSLGRGSLEVISSTLENLIPFSKVISFLGNVSFRKCTIGTLNSVHMIESLSFDTCAIDVIKSGAFTQNLFIYELRISDSKIRIIEKGAFAGSGITNLLLTKNRISTIEAKAIRVIAANVRIEKNDIVNTYNNWFDVSECSNIKIVNNAFGSLASINIANSSSAQPGACKFEGNSIQKPLPKSLNFQTPFCRIRKISVDRICTCNTSWLEQLSDRDLCSEIYCQRDRFNTTYNNMQEYRNIMHCEKKNIEEFIAIIILIYVVITVIALPLCVAVNCWWIWLRLKRGNPGKSLRSARGLSTCFPIYAESKAKLESSYGRTAYVYAERGGTQKPLLLFEHSLQSDRQEDQDGLYSEPIYNGVTSLLQSSATTKLEQTDVVQVHLSDMFDKSLRDFPIYTEVDITKKRLKKHNA